MQRQRIGKLGEDLALRAYEIHGWKGQARNVHYRDGELDLVLQKERQLLFVEVKTRQQQQREEIYPRFSATKIQRFKIACLRYLQDHPCSGWTMEVAIIDLDLSRKTSRIRRLTPEFFMR